MSDDFNPQQFTQSLLGGQTATAEPPDQPPPAQAPEDPQQFTRSLLGTEPPKSELQSKLEEAHSYYSENAEKFWGPGSGAYAADRIPGANIGVTLGRYANLSTALKNVRSGDFKDDDLYVIAQHRARSEYEANRTGTQQAVDELGKVTALAAEFAMSGGLSAGVKVAGAKAASRLVGEGLASRAAGYGAGLAAQTAMTPSLYIDNAVHGNLEKDRDPLDPRGLPQSFGLAMAQNAVLGEVGKLTGKLFTGSGLGQAAGRIATQAATGPIAQAATDVVTYGAGLSTGYGTIEQLLRKNAEGKWDPDTRGAMQSALLTSMQFAAFGAAHEISHGGHGSEGAPRDYVDKIVDFLKSKKEAGATPQEAADSLKEAMGTPPQTTESTDAFKAAFGVEMPKAQPPAGLAPEAPPPQAPPPPREAATALEGQLRQAQAELLDAKKAEVRERGNREMGLAHQHDAATEVRKNLEKQVKALQKETDAARVAASTQEAPPAETAKVADAPGIAQEAPPSPPAETPPESPPVAENAAPVAAPVEKPAIRSDWLERMRAKQAKPPEAEGPQYAGQEGKRTEQQQEKDIREEILNGPHQMSEEHKAAGLTPVESYVHDKTVGEGIGATELAKDKRLPTINTDNGIRKAQERASRKLGEVEQVLGKDGKMVERVKSYDQLRLERALKAGGFNEDGSQVSAEQVAEKEVQDHIAQMEARGHVIDERTARAEIAKMHRNEADKERAFTNKWSKFGERLAKDARYQSLSATDRARLNDRISEAIGDGRVPPKDVGSAFTNPDKAFASQAQKSPSVRSEASERLRPDSPQRATSAPEEAAGGQGPGSVDGGPAAAAGSVEPAKPVRNPDRITQNEWLRMHKKSTHPLEAEAIRLKNEGTRTFWQDIQEAFQGIDKPGRIDPGSIVEDFGKETIGEILPKSYFKKGGTALDEIAEHYGISEEEVIQKLIANQIVDGEAYLDRTNNAEQLAYQKGKFSNEFYAQHPEATEAEADKAFEKFIQAAGKSGADQGPPGDLAKQAGQPGQEGREPGHDPGDVGESAPGGGFSDDVPFRSEPGRNQPITGAGLIESDTPAGGAFRRAVMGFAADEAGSLDLDKVKEFAGLAKDRFLAGVRAVNLATRNLGHEMFPATHDASPELGNKTSTYATSGQQARRARPYFIDKVLGENVTSEQAHLWYTALQESRLRYAHADALARGDAEGAKNADRTFVGQKDSALKDEAHYLATLKDPEFKQAVENYKTEFVPVAEEYYKQAAGIDPADSIDSITQIPGLPVPFKAIREGDTGGSTLGTARGSLSAPKLRRLGATREAKFSADKYETDFREMLGHIIESRVETANKHEMFRTAVAERQAQWATPGPERITTEDGMVLRKMPDVNPPKGTQENARGETSLYVNEKIFEEMKNALNMNEPGSTTKMVRAVADKLNALNLLVSTGEFLYHGTSQMSQFFTKPGMRYSDLFSNIKQRYENNTDFKAKMMGIARLGADKPSYSEKGNDSILKYGSKMLDGLSDVMRATSHDAYQRLAEQARAGKIQFDDSPQAERNFINQLGKYERRSQAGAIQWLRDSGMGPFATAGMNYIEQGVGSLGLNPGIKGEGLYSKLYLRANFLKNLAIAAGTVAAMNYFRWGRVDGDDKTPFGNIKLWEDENGSHSIDVSAPFLIKRGLRSTGLLSMLEGGRGSAPTATNIDKAKDDMLHAFLHPAMGPAAQTALIAAKGYNTIGMQVAEKAKEGESQTLRNLKAAALNVNPILAEATGTARPNDKRPALERLSDLAGPYGIKTRKKPVGNQPSK